ncbi:hypothetical protein [Prevotella sp. KH2C16]|uniref:hypothetical protein n=1 Tax=Prevotella sp. KH2C16 TaxID=1855325 RepID=UPI0008E02B6C|nr:hypothetical protein [Prevotella sp. KH2C16]SFG25784.1 hypothetical protein SAMN05216383_10850 [Prevotella sp. KH2C16]
MKYIKPSVKVTHIQTDSIILADSEGLTIKEELTDAPQLSRPDVNDNDYGGNSSSHSIWDE